jgi:hypothetical protein
LANQTAGPLFAKCIADAVAKRPKIALKAETFGRMLGDEYYNPAEDENGDGDVDGHDIL